jgi:hypothetical protein
LLPIYEEAKDFKQLATLHQRIFTSYKTISDLIESGKRVFSTYYRLAFFGDPKLLPAEIRNQHFIYREKGIVTLSEVTLRVNVCSYNFHCYSLIRQLQELYSKIFRPECFELISDSKKVDAKALSEKANKVFVQVSFARYLSSDS